MQRADNFIHPTAVVDGPNTHIGADTKIWHFVHVMPGAYIGNRCSVGQGCFIGKVRIGHGCRIQNNVSIYDGVTLEDDVFLGPSCVFTNVKHPRAYADVLSRGELPVGGEEVLTDQDTALESVMLRIRLAAGLPTTDAGAPPATIAKFIAEGLLDGAAAIAGTLRLTSRGRLLADRVVRELT